MASCRIPSWQTEGEKLETIADFISLGSKITVDGDCNHDIKTLAPCKESYERPPKQHSKSQRYHFVNTGPHSQSYCFSSSLVWMWELDNKESWMLNNWCFWTMVLEKTLESPFNFKEIQPVYPKGNQHWTFIGRTDAEAETPTLWAPDVKKWLTGKDPDAGKDWRREEKGTAEDEMVRWHHWLDQHESEQAPGVDDGQGSLACFSPWGHKESDMTEWLNWTEFLGFNLSSYFSSVCFLAIVLFGLHLSVY